MASSNPNPQFDMSKLFKPQNPNPSNLNPPLQPPQSQFPPASSYPPHSGPYPFAPPPPQPPQYYHMPYPVDQIPGFGPQRSISFPVPPVHAGMGPSQGTNAGARLMALLGAPGGNFDYSNQNQVVAPSPLIVSSSSGGSDFGGVNVPGLNNVAMVQQQVPVRMGSSKVPRGRHLVGDHVVYDVDVRLQGEVQPQLEVTPITKYASDPELILGRQIAVNKTYICYGLKPGSIRVLNINTALRSLLKVHDKRVTDMVFFAEDVHLLASASTDGRVCVWKLSEGTDEEDKPQILGNIVIAVDITGFGPGDWAEPEAGAEPKETLHPREILVVAIGRSILRIDTIRVGKGGLVAPKLLECPLNEPIDGIQLVGRHDGIVTDLSMCQWMTTRLVSASKDGTIKIWEDRKAQPLLVLRPHDGQPVDAASFLTAPNRPDHIILITGGRRNREVKVWASSSEEGWLLPSDTESWRCIQTLELESSAEPQMEEAFFNQVVGLSQVGLLLLANAKKNAIYVVHLEYGANPLATRMDYLAEFTVTMPILSCTGTSDVLPHWEHVVQVYCVQTQAIQQYALGLSQCLPPPGETLVLEKSDSSAPRDPSDGRFVVDSSGSEPLEVSLATSTPVPSDQPSLSEGAPEIKGNPFRASDPVVSQENSSSSIESIPEVVLPVATPVDGVSAASPSVPMSPSLSRNLSDIHSNHTAPGSPIDRQVDHAQTYLPVTTSSDENRISQGNVSDLLSPQTMYRPPTHLVTPSELMATPSSENTCVSEGKSFVEASSQDALMNFDVGNVELEVKMVGEAGLCQDNLSEFAGPQAQVESIEKSFSNQGSDVGADLSRDLGTLQIETSVFEDSPSTIMEAPAQSSNSGDEVDGTTNDISEKSADFPPEAAVSQSPAPSKRKNKKGKNSQASGQLLPSNAYSLSDSSNDAGVSSTTLSPAAVFPRILAIQETINELVTSQKEIQKQMTTMVAAPVMKEGKRLETALARAMEKAAKGNADALWARFQEEKAKNEKLIRERTQQILNLVTNFANKELAAILEKIMKRELATVSANVARTVTPVVEKAIASSITESFQRGVGDKAVNQLDRSVSSKIEAIIARQVQAQFQTSGKQALQDGLKSTLEASLLPAFELSCKAMFEQIDDAFQKGMAEHTSSVQQQMESVHSPLAVALREAIGSVSSVTQSLSGELADGQRKLVALAAAGASSQAVNPLVTQLSNGPLAGLHDRVEQPFDPTKELSRLISEHKYAEAFTAALQRSDVSIVSWLCSQVDLQRILATVPPPLSQGVLLSLLQQLSCDFANDTPRKLTWMTDVAVAINPVDPLIAMHVRPIFEQVYQILNHHRSLLTGTPAEISSIRIIMHVINSMLMTIK
ncbi:Varicose-related protein [Drosera capensis]